MAYELLRKISKNLYESNPSLQDDYATVNSLDIKEIVENVCSGYQNARNLDKMSMAQDKVHQVKNVMQKNVEGMVKNIQDAEVCVLCSSLLIAPFIGPGRPIQKHSR